MRNPPRWPAPWAGLYRDTVDLVADAERRGAGAVWLTEHHGLEDGYLSQPLALAAALAVRTHSIRIGTAVLLAPLRHPLHVAEQAALVDVLSAGRLELGLGAGYVRSEFEAFGADEARRYQTTEACVRRLQALFAGGGLRPPPVQPDLPIWLGYQGPRGARRAGALGVGLLSLDGELYSHYLRGRTDAGLTGPGRVGGVVNMLLARDPEQALEQFLPHLAYHLNSYRMAMTDGREGRPPRVLEVDELRREFRATGAARGFKVADAGQACAELAAMTAGLPVEHLLFWCRIGAMPDVLVAEHLELLFGEVRRRIAALAVLPGTRLDQRAAAQPPVGVRDAPALEDLPAVCSGRRSGAGDPARCPREAGRRRRVDHAIAGDQRSPVGQLRVPGGLGEGQDRGHAGAGPLEDTDPLIPRALREPPRQRGAQFRPARLVVLGWRVRDLQQPDQLGEERWLDRADRHPPPVRGLVDVVVR